jgi:hypothetical protein
LIFIKKYNIIYIETKGRKKFMTQERKDQLFEALIEFFRDTLAAEDRKETLAGLGFTEEEVAELAL